MAYKTIRGPIIPEILFQISFVFRISPVHGAQNYRNFQKTILKCKNLTSESMAGFPTFGAIPHLSFLLSQLIINIIN